MDNIKSKIAFRVEILTQALDEPNELLVSSGIKNVPRYRYDIVNRIYCELRPQMLLNKKHNGLAEYHDEIEEKIYSELRRLERGAKNKFHEWLAFWEQELISFYREEFEDIEFTYEAA